MKDFFFKLLIFLWIIGMQTLHSYAQNQECLTISSPNRADELYFEQLRNRQFKSYTKQNLDDVLVQPHIVSDDNGNFGLSTDMEIVKNNLNNAFADVGFQFIFCSTNYINNSRYHDNIVYEFQPEENEMASRYNRSNAVNIYFLKKAYTSWAPRPGGNNWIIVRNSHANKNNIVAHEMGHHFNLLHTHSNTYGDESVARTLCGKSCIETGDRMCETPADPNPERLPLDLSTTDDLTDHLTLGDYLDGCNLIPGGFPITDNCGYYYSPDPKNIMSYGRDCRTYFTSDQLGHMAWIRENVRTNLASDCSNIIAPNCNDGKWNADEKGIDCGNSCPPCNNDVPNGNVSFECESDCSANLILHCGAVGAVLEYERIVISNAQVTNSGEETIYNVNLQYSLTNDETTILLDPFFESALIIEEIESGQTVAAPAPLIDVPDGLSGIFKVHVRLLNNNNSCMSISSLYINYEFPIDESCWDAIQNQGELGIDCGGPCPAACPSCADGIQNQGEHQIDCGGPCEECEICHENLTLTQINDGAIYKANNTITGLGPITQNIGDVKFNAGRKVSLLTGFIADARESSYFEAQIQNCGEN